MKVITNQIQDYNQVQAPDDALICKQLAQIIDSAYIGKIDGASSKIWHGHPVWFINENPIVGYSKQKRGIRLMFWSGKDFDESALNIIGEKFKDASIFYNSPSEIDGDALLKWLEKGVAIQWDYKNIVKRKGILEKL